MVGSSRYRLPLLVGLAPTVERHPPSCFSSLGRSGRRLARTCGVSDVREIFDTVNLFERPVFGRPPRALLRKKAGEIPVRGRVVVLAGRDVALAFGYGTREWLTYDVDETRGCVFWFLPHPSGLSRWWNDPENEGRAGCLLRNLATLAWYARESAVPRPERRARGALA